MSQLTHFSTSSLKNVTPPSMELFYAEKALEPLLQALENAQETIDLYTFSLSSKDLIEVLNRKASEGIRININIDSNHCGMDLWQSLDGNINISLQMDEVEGHYHHKTAIIDNNTIWSASGNFTNSGFNKQLNLYHLFKSSTFANQMQGALKEKKASSYQIKESLGPMEIEYWHLPASEGKLASNEAKQNVLALKRIEKMIQSAQKTIFVANAGFTNHKLADALVSASLKGIEVTFFHQGGLDSFGLKVLHKLKQAGVKLCQNPTNKLLHHKFMLCDSKVLLNGSPNWSSRAFSKNAESFFIFDSLSIEQQEMMQKYIKQLSNSN